MANEAVKALAEGDLRQTPVMHLVLYLHDQSSTGTLVVSSPTGQRSLVRFKEGRPVAGRFPHTSRGLEAGLLPLFGYPSGSYTFYKDDLLAPGPGVHEGAIDPYGLAAMSIDNYCRDDIVDALLLRYGDHAMRLQPGRPIDRLRLPPRARGLVELLRASPDTVDSLVANSPLDRGASRRVLYLLVVTKMVAPYQPKPGDRSDSRVRARQTVSRESTASRRPLVTTGNPTPSGHPLVAVTTGQDTPAGGMRTSRSGGVSALESLASMRPPSRPSNRAAGATKNHVTVESHVDENDPEVRYRRATSRLKAGKCDEAVGLLEKLAEEFPNRANYHGMLAHALWEQRRSEESEDGVPRQLTDAIRRALELDDECARALYVKGLLYKHADKQRKALACFRRAARADRSLLDAKREARLLGRRLS